MIFDFDFDFDYNWHNKESLTYNVGLISFWRWKALVVAMFLS
jgi:hypothetical protein